MINLGQTCLRELVCVILTIISASEHNFVKCRIEEISSKSKDDKGYKDRDM